MQEAEAAVLRRSSLSQPMAPRLLAPGGMSCRAPIAAVGLMMLAIGFSGVAAQELPLAASCPAYVTHLRSARESLERGDRAGAVAALRQAQEALATCLREAAQGEVRFVARRCSTPAS